MFWLRRFLLDRYQNDLCWDGRNPISAPIYNSKTRVKLSRRKSFPFGTSVISGISSCPIRKLKGIHYSGPEAQMMRSTPVPFNDVAIAPVHVGSVCAIQIL